MKKKTGSNQGDDMSDQTIDGLNKHLFDQLDKLSAAKGKDELKNEIERSKALSNVSRDILSSAKLSLEAQQYVDRNRATKRLPTLLAIGPQVPV